MFWRDLELSADVFENGGRRRRRQTEHTLSTKRSSKSDELEIVGTKIVSPFRDAVGFVHGEERDVHPAERLAKPLVVEALRGNVKEPKSTGTHFGHHPAQLVESQRGIDASRRDALRGKRVDLVFHESDQRRDDDRQTIQQQRGQLVTKGLASPCWKHRRGRVAVEQMANHFRLPRAKVREAPVALQLLPGSLIRHVDNAVRRVGLIHDVLYGKAHAGMRFAHLSVANGLGAMSGAGARHGGGRHRELPRSAKLSRKAVRTLRA